MQEPLSRLKIEDLTTSNEAMARCLQLAALAAKSEVPVVLLGETGTGKTLLAHAIHNSSARAGRPRATGKISRGPLSAAQRPNLAHSSPSRAVTGATDADRRRIESGWVKRRERHHGDSSRSNGEVASP